jgi:hypothetical protein
MHISQRISTILTQLALRTAQNPFGSQVMMLALPLTFALAVAIVTHQPVLITHSNPACGANSGGGGGC